MSSGDVDLGREVSGGDVIGSGWEVDSGDVVDSEQRMSGPYDDIIDLSRPKSNFPPIDEASRAAQFAPFAALVGFARRVRETDSEHREAVENEITVEYDEGAIWEEENRQEY